MFWLALILTFLFPQTVLAQEATASSTPEFTPTPTIAPTPSPHPSVTLYEQYKNDYLFLYDQYNKAYLTYVDKKQVYTKYGTITTQKEKMEATKNVLVARNTMMRTYLTALRVHLEPHQHQNPTDTDKIKIDLQKWEDWFNEQNTIVSSMNNDSDISEWASNFKEKYVQIQQVIYTALVINESNSRLTTLAQIKELATDIQKSPAIDTQSSEWFGSFPVKIDLVNGALKNALNTTKRSQYASVRFKDFYPDAKAELNTARNYLIDLNNNLKGIVIKFIQND